MSLLHDKLAKIIPPLREETRNLVKANASLVISEVTVAQAFGGMRGVKGLVCDTSLVEPDKGLIIRGYPILDIQDRLPEDIFWLLVAGELPTEEESADLRKDLAERKGVPQYVWDVLHAMPEDSHPMCMFDTAILAMERESEFRRRYSEGMKKTEYWEPMLEDSLNLIAKLPEIAAGVYRIRYKKGDRNASNPGLDMGADYVAMLGIGDRTGEFANLMRLYLTLHSDHEGGNVSANTCHTVGSALSDAYYAVSAGLNGLAGPLHGLANQECLKFVLSLQEKFGGVPSDEALKEFAWETLNSGQVIPGYGHAVLRVPDPRYVAFREFGLRVCGDDPVFQIVDKLFNVVPGVLKEHGKAKNPWPNVDAGSGSLLYHFGLREFDYYTVLFSVSRALGMLSQLIVNRALGTAITRPKSVTTDWVKAQTEKAQAGA
ncbi:citrate (Si)-synthase [bacterium]|nr:citrate (Si)-synthase [bacterium]